MQKDGTRNLFSVPKLFFKKAPGGCSPIRIGPLHSRMNLGFTRLGEPDGQQSNCSNVTLAVYFVM